MKFDIENAFRIINFKVLKIMNPSLRTLMAMTVFQELASAQWLL
jgi:hypothetical protein